MWLDLCSSLNLPSKMWLNMNCCEMCTINLCPKPGHFSLIEGFLFGDQSYPIPCLDLGLFQVPKYSQEVKLTHDLCSYLHYSHPFLSEPSPSISPSSSRPPRISLISNPLRPFFSEKLTLKAPCAAAWVSLRLLQSELVSDDFSRGSDLRRFEVLRHPLSSSPAVDFSEDCCVCSSFGLLDDPACSSVLPMVFFDILAM